MLVLGHTFSDQPEVVTDLIAQPVTMWVVRWAETKVPLTLDGDRPETDVPRGRKPADGIHSFRVDSR